MIVKDVPRSRSRMISVDYKKFITMERIVQTEFQDVSVQKIKQVLTQHNLFGFIQKSISLINKHLADQNREVEQFSSINISHLASAILIKANEYLRYSKYKRKEEIEYLLGSMMKRILKMIIDSIPMGIRKNQLQLIQCSLLETCELFKYNFEELSKFIQIDALVREIYAEYTLQKKKTAPPQIPTTTKCPALRCRTKNTKQKLSELIDLIIKLEITDEKEKLHKLFQSPAHNLAIRLNEEKATYVMQFFVALYGSTLVESDTEKYGFYQVLEFHVLNFRETFLKGKDAWRGADRVRKLRSWDERKEEFEQHFLSLI